mmetsp:Transcript_16134/g.13690  ORF Transcript_16134/g.13690 Transcript_16134/m.13690 type:complete len:145 (+) Transcript_16134:254-688(+)
MGIFIIRAILVAIIFTYFYEYPKAQTVILTLMSVGIILYDVTKRPFLSIPNMIELISYELIILMANVAATIMAFNPDDIDMNDKCSDVIIVSFFMFSVAAILFMIIAFVIGLRDAIKTAKMKKGKVSLMEIIAIPFQVGGMDFG